ncbi:hypothetical protein ABBQ38_001922 [Trebouxia sp. C0009 RCD-2024]
MLSLELQQEWYGDRNAHLGAIQVTPYSRIEAVWQCDKCPAGQPHVWTACIQARTRGTKCPFCSKRVCLHNSLATIAPDVACYWNYSKNETVPEQLLAGSHYRAEWKCPACKHEWKAPVARRTRVRSGCPKCSVRQRRQHRSLPLLKLSLQNWLSGTMSAMMQRASSHTRSLLAAPSWCTGSAHVVQRGGHTAGQQPHPIVLDKARDVPSVLAIKLVSATLWRLWFQLWRLSLTLRIMALRLRMSQLGPTRRCGGGMQKGAAGSRP